ncbi:metalloregulator ArsR/SmtB family transcription factor [Pseudomonadota bacterium]|nr:metalloregulator ArsR/SmtB family transcription factor [Pseudomonadota bacterium]
MSVDADTFFSVLSHPMRLRSLVLIQQTGELCVCELTYVLALAQPVISRHLAQLKHAGLLLSRRQGLWIYYRVNAELPEWVKQLIEVTTSGVASTSPYMDDLAKLKSMSDRPNQNCC